MISTKRLARVIVYLGVLFKVVDVDERSKFLQGTLFALGGLLKVEARNYMETKKKYNPSFRVVCPLTQESKAAEESMQRNQRDLSDADIEFFESETGFLPVVCSFVQSIAPGKTLTSDTLDYYMDFTKLDFIDVMD